MPLLEPYLAPLRSLEAAAPAPAAEEKPGVGGAAGAGGDDGGDGASREAFQRVRDEAQAGARREREARMQARTLSRFFSPVQGDQWVLALYYCHPWARN